MESERKFIPNPEKPKFVYHGSDKLFTKVKTGSRSRPDNKNVPRLFASPNPAFAAAQGGFEWYSDDGIDVKTDDDTGQIIFVVPQEHAHKLKNPMYMYKMSGKNFERTNGEKTGHTWDTEEGQELLEPPQKFNTVREAVEHFGGKIVII